MSLVSIIIPCYNAQKWLREAIDSCLSQTHKEREIIVVDDGSTDQTVAIAREYGSRLILESLAQNQGVSYARNVGFQLSKGDYIQYLDGDDFLAPDKLKAQTEFLELTQADVAYGDWSFQIHKAGKITRTKIQATEPADMVEALLGTWWVMTASYLVRRTAVAASGGWDVSLRANEDRDFFLALAIEGRRFAYQPGETAFYRRHRASAEAWAGKERWVIDQLRVMDKAVAKLKAQHDFPLNYQQALTQSYYPTLRKCLDFNYALYREKLVALLSYYPAFEAPADALYNRLQARIGFEKTELLYSWVLAPYRRVGLFIYHRLHGTSTKRRD